MIDSFDFRIYFFLLVSVNSKLPEQFGQLDLHRIAGLLPIDHCRALFPPCCFHFLEFFIKLSNLIFDCNNLQVILRIIWLFQWFLWHGRNDSVHRYVEIVPFISPLAELVLAKTWIEFALASKWNILSWSGFPFLILGLFSFFSRSQLLYRLLLLLVLRVLWVWQRSIRLARCFRSFGFGILILLLPCLGAISSFLLSTLLFILLINDVVIFPVTPVITSGLWSILTFLLLIDTTCRIFILTRLWTINFFIFFLSCLSIVLSIRLAPSSILPLT